MQRSCWALSSAVPLRTGCSSARLAGVEVDSGNHAATRGPPNAAHGDPRVLYAASRSYGSTPRCCPDAGKTDGAGRTFSHPRTSMLTDRSRPHMLFVSESSSCTSAFRVLRHGLVCRAAAKVRGNWTRRVALDLTGTDRSLVVQVMGMGNSVSVSTGDLPASVAGLETCIPSPSPEVLERIELLISLR